MINYIITSITELQKDMMLVHEGEQGATCTFFNFRIFTRFPLKQYLRGGLNYSVITAIDYTISNGNQNSQRSLHYTKVNEEDNQYESTMRFVDEELPLHGNSKRFTAFGFGGIPRHLGRRTVEHCFALNGNPMKPEIQDGLQGLLKMYKKTLS